MTEAIEVEPISDEQLAEIAGAERLAAVVGDHIQDNDPRLDRLVRGVMGLHSLHFPALLARFRKAEAREKRYRAELEWIVGWKMAEDDTVGSRLLRTIHRRAAAALKETGHE